MNTIQTCLVSGLLAVVLLSSGCKHDQKNHAPVAYSASVTTSADTEVRGQLMASDSDGDRLLFAVVNQPEQGVLTVNASGKFSYRPNADTTGTDQFSFTVSDKTQTSVAATVTIRVNALQVTFSSYSRQAYAQADIAQALPLNSRDLQLDVTEETAYDDLLP